MTDQGMEGINLSDMADLCTGPVLANKTNVDIHHDISLRQNRTCRLFAVVACFLP